MSLAFLFPLLALIPSWTQSNRNQKRHKDPAYPPPPNSATGQNRFVTLLPKGHVSQTSSVLHRKWLCPGGITSGDILLSISGTHKKGSEGKKELSGYFLVEISVVTHLLKTHYLKGKCTYTQLLHSQYNPFQISVVFHCMKFRVFYTTVPLKTVHMKSN